MGLGITFEGEIACRGRGTRDCGREFVVVHPFVEAEIIRLSGIVRDQRFCRVHPTRRQQIYGETSQLDTDIAGFALSRNRDVYAVLRFEPHLAQLQRDNGCGNSTGIAARKEPFFVLLKPIGLMFSGGAKLRDGQFRDFARNPGDRDRMGAHERRNVESSAPVQRSLCVAPHECIGDPPRIRRAQSARGQQSVGAARGGAWIAI